MAKLYEVWESVLTWWDRVIPTAVDRFAQEGADDLQRYSYSQEEIDEITHALSLDQSVATGQRARVLRMLVGTILEVLAQHQCGLDDLEVQVNLTHVYDRAHPEWSRVLMRELLGRRVCVWVCPREE